MSLFLEILLKFDPYLFHDWSQSRNFSIQTSSNLSILSIVVLLSNATMLTFFKQKILLIWVNKAIRVCNANIFFNVFHGALLGIKYLC